MIQIKPGLEAIFWDFDGVLMDSNAVRDKGFSMVLADYPPEQVNELLVFHKANGGLSRYVKFRYFFETVRNEKISEEEVLLWADRFSVIMKQNLLNGNLLIEETLSWIKDNHSKHSMHVVSGSDQTELRYLCEHHGISRYFKDIVGSPTPKKQLVAALLHKYNYTPANCLLVGDSTNDYDAASENGLMFLPYNNPSISSLNSYL